MNYKHCSNFPSVSIIVPIHNGEEWINDCFDSILNQDILKSEKIEISIYNDSSFDNTQRILLDWQKKFQLLNIPFVLSSGTSGSPKGVGFAKNRAVEQSHGEFLCFQDIDDVMLPARISAQLTAAKENPNSIIGCQVKRLPADSTIRFTSWINSIPTDLLTKQIFTSNGPTVIMPTWFCSRSVYNRVGHFSETGKGTPEDLIFFYKHLDLGGSVHRVDQVLLIYRYHSKSATLSVSADTIWNICLDRLVKTILPKWDRFSIWNAGRRGRKFYRALSAENRKKVVQFYDVDEKKIGKYHEPYLGPLLHERRKIPIVHFTECKPPIVVCMKLGFTNGEFESNLKSLNLKEGQDYVFFS